MSYTDPHKWIGFDVESSGELPEYGLQPWSGRSWLTSFAISNYNLSQTKILGAVYPDIWRPESVDEIRNRLNAAIRKILKYALQHNHTLVGWNTAFDAAWLIKMGYRDEVMKLQWLDIMQLWKHVERTPEWGVARHNKKKWGLKEAVAEYLPQWAGYGDDVDFHDTSEDATNERLKYNKLDACLTHRLGIRFMKILMEPGRERQLRTALVEAKSIPLVADHYMTGLHVNEKDCHRLGEHILHERMDLLEVLKGEGATEKILASPTQLATLIYEEWGLPLSRKTAKGAPSTDKVALYDLSFIDDRADMVKRYREFGMNKKKFVDNVLESCEYNGHHTTHPTAIINGTYTGRMTFASSVGKNKEKRQTGFALHQMKRSAEYRRPISAPPGYTLVEWDAAGQEYRWVAIESADPTMLSLCEPGEDPHSYMAAEMTEYTYQLLREAYAKGEDGAYETRMAGKVGNLSCQYRIGAPSLLVTARVQYGLPWDLAMSQHVHRAYHRTYPGVKKYWKRKVAEAKRQGYAETIAGRRVKLEGQWFGDTQWQMESTAINFPIQGVGADQKYLAIAAIKPLLTNYGGKFYFELHDGLYAIFPEKVAEKAAYEGRHLLSNLPYQKVWGFTPPIPLPWDMKIGPNWGDLEERE